jgi:hypothetical protein
MFYQVRFELEGQGPSWWEGSIKGMMMTIDSGSVYLVIFDDFNYTNIYSTQHIRRAVGMPRMSLKTATIPIPRKLVVLMDNLNVFAFVCLRVINNPSGDVSAVIIGHPDDVDAVCERISELNFSELEKIANYVRILQHEMFSAYFF